MGCIEMADELNGATTTLKVGRERALAALAAVRFGKITDAQIEQALNEVLAPSLYSVSLGGLIVQVEDEEVLETLINRINPGWLG